MKKEIKNMLPELESRAVYYAWILGYNAYGLASTGRNQTDVFARMAIFWHLREDGFSCISIADFFNKNHSSILYGQKQVNQAIDMPGMYKLLYSNWKRIAERKDRYEHASFINNNIWVCLEKV